MANVKNMDLDKFFNDFDDAISDIVRTGFNNMSRDVRERMTQEARKTIMDFYNDYTTPHTSGKYDLFVPNHLLGKEETDENPESLIRVYWRRHMDLLNAVRTEKARQESNKKKGYYRYTNRLIIDTKNMNQSVHRMDVGLILTRSFELGIHGYNKNDLDVWANNKKTNWYLPRSTMVKTQPYKKRGAWHMNHWMKSFYKKEIASGKLTKVYFNNMIDKISQLIK